MSAAKLQRLKGLVRDASAQVRAKLKAVRQHILSITEIEQVNYETKFVCSLLIEIKQARPCCNAAPRSGVLVELVPGRSCSGVRSSCEAEAGQVKC